MNGFPWGLLTLILLVLDLILTGIYLIRKRIIKSLCRHALARGNDLEVGRLMHLAEKQRLLKPAEYMA